jgi:thiol-disulfide isomerase/thioredoxin
MFNTLLKLFLLLSLLKFDLYSGHLTIQPDKPIENQEIQFRYFPDKNIDTTEVKLILYLFKSGSIEPEAVELNLIRQDSLYFNKFIFDSQIAFLLIKVLAGGNYVTNFQEFWDFVIYTNDGIKPKKNALYFKAYSYLGSLPENCQRLASFTKAIEYYEEELKFYPDNHTALLSLLLLKFDRKRISKNDFQASIKKIYDIGQEDLDESATILLIRTLKLIKEDKKAEKIENSYIYKHPSSKLSQEKELKQLSVINHFREFNFQAFEFLRKYQNSHLREKIWIALIQSYLQNNNLRDLVDKVFQYDYIPYSIYTRLGFNLLKNDNSYSDFELDSIINTLTMKALTTLNEDIKYQKPSYYSLTEWEKISRVNKSKLFQEWGDLLSLSNKDKEAMEKYLIAIDLLKDDYPISLSESSILQASKLNQDSIALQIASQAILDSKSTNFIDSVCINLQSKYKKENSKESLDSLKRIADINRRARITKNLLNIYSEIHLQTTENSIINLNNYKGNVIILALWAKWCDPCLDLLKFLETYDRKGLINRNIIIFPVNSLDTDYNSNTNFLKQNKISCQVFHLMVVKLTH